MEKISAFLLTFVIALSLYSTNPAHASTQHNENLTRAIKSYQGMQTFLYKPNDQLYLETYPYNGGNPYSYVWEFSQAYNATLDMALLPKVGQNYSTDITDRVSGLMKYWNSNKQPSGFDSYVDPPYGNGGDMFYDDNEWIGLASIQHYSMTHDKSSLKRAEDIFKLIVYGWDNNPNDPAPGGVFWTQASWSHDRNTISNATGAKLGLNLYLITKDPYYLNWSKKMYDWVNTNMLAPNGLYWDHIDLQGNIQQTQWSYNQGVMIGANVLLYQSTHNKEYLNRADNLANTAIQYYETDNRLTSQPAVFNAIFFRNLLKLSTFNHDQHYIKFINAYATMEWNTNRDNQTNLFSFGDIETLQQAGMVQIYSLLSLKKDEYKLIP